MARFPFFHLTPLLLILGQELTIRLGGGTQLSPVDVALQTFSNKCGQGLLGRFDFCDLAQ
ncbi:MAG: hypothetical protein ABI217_09630 [Chthoniobacterales bacterium]